MLVLRRPRSIAQAAATNAAWSGVSTSWCTTTRLRPVGREPAKPRVRQPETAVRHLQCSRQPTAAVSASLTPDSPCVRAVQAAGLWSTICCRFSVLNWVPTRQCQAWACRHWPSGRRHRSSPHARGPPPRSQPAHPPRRQVETMAGSAGHRRTRRYDGRLPSSRVVGMLPVTPIDHRAATSPKSRTAVTPAAN